MFECRACLLRTLRAVAADGLNAQVTSSSAPQRLLLTPRLTLTQPQPPIRRAASTSAATKHVADELLPGARSDQSDAFDQHGADRQRGPAVKDTKALRTELKYLSDPLKLAEHVHYTLRCNKPDKALDLCRLASKQQEVIVSWNHCIDWHMAHGRIDEAIKIYNEMKKRAQFPDSHTYVLLLRGLAKPHHHGGVVKKANVVRALSIYNSMSSPTSRVQPSIYHTNATLQVCSAALDMDALWSVAAKLPSRGHGAPDHVTYSTLLTAIRNGAMGSVAVEDRVTNVQVEQIASRRQEAVNQGRRIWQEIIPKWRAGEVHIDEPLVCTMGQLLLISKRMQDWDDVLNLIQQTMDVERQIAPIGSPDRNTGHVPQELQAVEALVEDSLDYHDAPSTKAFYAVKPLQSDPSRPKRPTTLAYITPGNATFTILIKACSLLRAPKAANAYWDVLTSPEGPYSVRVDLHTFNTQLKLLGLNRSSARAVRVLQSMPENDVIPQNSTFRIAMSTCVRDKNNANALGHARAIVDELEKHSPDPDVHTLMQYLNLALLTDDGPKIVSALDRLDPIVHNLRSRVTYRTDEQKISAPQHLRDGQQIIAFFQAIIGVIDNLMHRGLVPREDFTQWHGRRSMLTQFIGRSRGRLDRRKEEELSQHGRDRDVDAEDDPFAQGNGARDGNGVWVDRKAGQKKGPGLQMSHMEFSMRKVRWAEKDTQRKEAGRQRAIGLRKWELNRSGSREIEALEAADQGAEGFADSPMELGMK